MLHLPREIVAREIYRRVCLPICYGFSFPYSALACFITRLSGLAPFQSTRKSW